MKHKYYRGKSFWLMPIDNNASCTWKHILWLRTNGRKFFKKVITDGTTTSLWQESWINCKCLVDLLGLDGFQLIGSPQLTVDHIISNGVLDPFLNSATWEIANRIQQVQMHPDRGSDFYEWREGKEFNFPVAWDKIRHRDHLQNWTKLVWHHKKQQENVFHNISSSAASIEY